MPPKRRKVKAKHGGVASQSQPQLQFIDDASASAAASSSAEGEGENRKRRPASETPEEPVSDAAAATTRGSRSATRAIVERMRADPRYSAVDKTEAKRIRADLASKIAVVDVATGEQREVDVSKREDIDFLIKNQSADVLARDEGELGKPPKDMSTGMTALRRENLPDDVNATGVLPLHALELKKYMRDSANSLSDILIWMPLINLPIYTPKLQLLLMLGTPTWPTQDSFQQLRTYIAVLKLLMHSETIRTRGHEAMDWLATRVEDRTIVRGDIESIFQHATFRPQTVLDTDTDPDLDYSVLNSEDAEEAARERWVGQLRDDHLRTFDDNMYGMEHVDELHSAILTVNKYDGASWAKSNHVFAEDIMDEHLVAGQQLCAEVGDAIDAIVDQTDASAILGVIMTYTIRLLRLYEVAIMRVLSHASLIGKTIPDTYFGELASKCEQMPTPEDVHVTVRKLVRAGREEVAKVRSEALGFDAPPSPNPVYESVADNAHADVVPSIQELRFYVDQFLNYNAEEARDLVEVIERMQKAVHITEPVPIIEGISVGNVETGVVEVKDSDDTVMM